MITEKDTSVEDKDYVIILITDDVVILITDDVVILITDDVIILITDDVAVLLCYHQNYAKACVKLCLLLQMLTTAKYMTSLHYNSDITCPTTNI